MNHVPEEKLDSLRFEFQWHVDDLPSLESLISQYVTPSWNSLILMISRVIAYALTFLVAWILLPGVDLMLVFLIAFTGSLSIWVAVFTYKLLLQHMHRMEAMDSMKVGWIYVRIDHTGILRNTDTSQTYHSWFSVSEVREHQGAIWIKTGRTSGEFLPARLFDETLTPQACIERIAQFRANPSEPAHMTARPDDAVTTH